MHSEIVDRRLTHKGLYDARQPGLRPANKHRGLTAVNCLKCATRQLQHLLIVPRRGGSQQGSIERLSDAITTTQQGHSSQVLSHQQQQHDNAAVLQLWLQQQHSCQQPQLAYAGSSSSGECSLILGTDASFRGQHVFSRVQSQSMVQQYVAMSAVQPDQGSPPPATSNAAVSSGSNTDCAVVDGLPPLSSLVGQPSSKPEAHQLQLLQQQGTTGSADSSRTAESSSECAGGSSEAQQPAQEDSAGVKAALATLRWYKSVLSPMMQSTCRFLPTCSQYSMDSYRNYGVAKGTVLTAWRLLRCNPWGPSGYDPTQWPPPGLAWLFQYQYSAEVAVVVGAATFIRLAHALLFE